jgi:hypothetical protein
VPGPRQLVEAGSQLNVVVGHSDLCIDIKLAELVHCHDRVAADDATADRGEPIAKRPKPASGAEFTLGECHTLSTYTHVWTGSVQPN